MQIGHRKEFLKLMPRALAFSIRSNKGLTLETFLSQPKSTLTVMANYKSFLLQSYLSCFAEYNKVLDTGTSYLLADPISHARCNCLLFYTSASLEAPELRNGKWNVKWNGWFTNDKTKRFFLCKLCKNEPLTTTSKEIDMTQSIVGIRGYAKHL